LPRGEEVADNLGHRVGDGGQKEGAAVNSSDSNIPGVLIVALVLVVLLTLLLGSMGPDAVRVFR
jgi:hypothetical protein